MLDNWQSLFTNPNRVGSGLRGWFGWITGSLNSNRAGLFIQFLNSWPPPRRRRLCLPCLAPDVTPLPCRHRRDATALSWPLWRPAAAADALPRTIHWRRPSPPPLVVGSSSTFWPCLSSTSPYFHRSSRQAVRHSHPFLYPPCLHCQPLWLVTYVTCYRCRPCSAYRYNVLFFSLFFFVIFLIILW